MTDIGGALFVLILCPLIGGLPLIEWSTRALTGRKLSGLGTGNIGVSAAFYHGGRLAGIIAVISEAFKGIIAVLGTRLFFPPGSAWEIVALIALVTGRYWFARGAGTTNTLWGLLVHDPIGVFLALLLSGISFTIFRHKSTGRLVGLFLLSLILTLRHINDSGYILAVLGLGALLYTISSRVADDLDLPETDVNPESARMFNFFRGDRSILSLNDPLDPAKAGQKAATLAFLKNSGYPVPEGWILPAGDDARPLIEKLQPRPDRPLVVRSSAVGEDSIADSSAGQYTTILNVIDREGLEAAILACQTSYNAENARHYRNDRGQAETSLCVLVQEQIRGVFSGVGFSRDPVNPLNPDVVIEALPGDATRVVSGRFTPESYRFNPEENTVIGAGDVPRRIIEGVGKLCRELEDLYHGIPIDIEWTHDGEKLWLLQCRPITNLQPLWTRKIAAEVIPGVIRPLTWSINRPLTCGVWGDIFTLVLGERARDLDFNETATLHYGRAYFNATLLGDIFRKMGLPAESLEFLTRGAKFTKPPLSSTLGNLGGLLRLLGREWNLEKDFRRDNATCFTPTLNLLESNDLNTLTREEILNRVEVILTALRGATYYSILAPLSFALRGGIFKVSLETLDNSRAPEVASLRELNRLKKEFSGDREGFDRAFEGWLREYGYLSEVGTDISIERWRENPAVLLNQPVIDFPPPKKAVNRGVQARLDLKNRVTEVYSRLLAHLRWHFLALESIYLEKGLLGERGDIFYLEYSEIRDNDRSKDYLSSRVALRRLEFQEALELSPIPYIIYGTPPDKEFLCSPITPKSSLRGIGASAGRVEGRVKILKSLENIEIEPGTILVVPYTDSGWSPLLSRAAGIVAEVGGQLSHGAIIAREYRIPAVMDVHGVLDILKDGQLIRIDGSKGIVEILGDG